MMTDRDLTPRLPGGLSEKIFRRHRERSAIVYIRQSTVQQVERHQESTRLQYACCLPLFLSSFCAPRSHVLMRKRPAA